MTLQDLGNIGEFLGSVGVIVSLLYLAVQIRQNTRSVRAAAGQSFVDANARFAGLLLHNEHMARVYRLGINDHSKLSDDERVQFDMLMVTYFRTAQNVFLREETLESDVWEGTMRNVLWYMRQPGVLEWWKTRRGMFGGRFCEFLEANANGKTSVRDPAA